MTSSWLLGLHLHLHRLQDLENRFGLEFDSGEMIRPQTCIQRPLYQNLTQFLSCCTKDGTIAELGPENKDFVLCGYHMVPSSLFGI